MKGFELTNRSGYDTSDLRRFFARGLRALRAKHPVRIEVTSAPQRSRGCADICTNHRCERRISIAIAPPSHFSLRRLARLFEHEFAHTLGMQHHDMNERLLYSLGPTPEWARGSVIRYRHRAPGQMRLLARRNR